MLVNYPLDVFDRTDGVAPRWPTVGIKLSAMETVVKSRPGVDDVVSEAMACLHTLLDNTDRYYVDKARAAKTIFVDSMGITATEFDVAPAQQHELFENGRAAAKAWIAKQEKPKT